MAKRNEGKAQTMLNRWISIETQMISQSMGKRPKDINSINNVQVCNIWRNQVIKEIAKKAGVSQKAAGDILSATLETIEKTVSKGKKVTLVGFGTFEARKRAARTGRNPQTGAELKIAAKTVPAFSAGKKFKELVK